jgi:superfamily II DNA or RNA helicase
VAISGRAVGGDLAKVMGERELAGDIVTTWQSLADGRPTFGFFVSCAHAKDQQERFEAAGGPAAYVDAETTMAEREKILRDFHEGAVKIVCSVGTLTTGVDRDVRCIIMARPTKSDILFVQMIGRGLRPAEGKTDLLILDHSSNHARLGFVTDIHHATLDIDEPRAKQEPSRPLPSRCPKCRNVPTSSGRRFGNARIAALRRRGRFRKYCRHASSRSSNRRLKTSRRFSTASSNGMLRRRTTSPLL